ncbi:MAG: NADPH-dependent FMN reductase [Nitrososphaeraceae archaeon]
MATIALILGSVRRDRQGGNVGMWLEEKLKTSKHLVNLIDPLVLDLPLLDRMYKEMTPPSKKLTELRTKIVDADGYMAVTPEYNHSTCAAMKNTLDYFLEEYYFKPSAIVSFSVGAFGGINAVQHLRNIFAELGAPTIPSALSIPKVHAVFANGGELLDATFERRYVKFVAEFEWYIEALRNQRTKGTPY